MEELAQACRERGAVTGVLVLPGHTGDWRELAEAGPEDYIDRGRRALAEVRLRSQELGISRVRLIGMSMGALVMLRVLAEEASDDPFQDGIFLSPALVLRLWARLLEGPAGWLPDATPIVSFSRRRDRVFGTLPVASYRSLYQLIDEVTERLSARPVELPLRIYMSRRDELLSVDGTAELIASGALPNAELITAAPGSNRRPGESAPDAGNPPSESRERSAGPSHLLVDRESMGDALWEDLLAYL
jgi:esterase/lipase